MRFFSVHRNYDRGHLSPVFVKKGLMRYYGNVKILVLYGNI